MNYRQKVCAKSLAALFNRTFYQRYNTQLVGGGHEPEYIPVGEKVNYHRIIFTRDYVASALHEIAHWCIAGKLRREQHDYGYWYIPDGRSASEQANFEKVEAKSQALEWIFTQAAGCRFSISIDNLDNTESLYAGPSERFKNNIANNAKYYCEGGLNDRALIWLTALVSEYSNSDVSECLSLKHYTLDELS